MGWALWYYIGLLVVLSTGGAIAMWWAPRWGATSWLRTFCWVPPFVFGFEFVGQLTAGHYADKHSIGPFVWTGVPGMTAWRWTLVALMAFCLILMWALFSSMPRLAWVALVAFLVLAAWFVFLTGAFMVWWMWVLLFIGVLASFVERLLLVSVLATLAVLVFSVLSLDWFAGSGTANEASSQPTISIKIDSVTDGVVTMEVPQAPKGLTDPLVYHWEIRGSDGKNVPGSPLPQQGQKVVSPKLNPGDYHMFVYVTGKNGKASAPASHPVTVPQPGAAPPPNPAAGDCTGTWKIDYGSTSTDNAMVSGGVPSIQTATNSDQARAALLDQLEAIKANPQKLAQAIHLNLPGHPVVKVSDLVDGACASQTAYGYYIQLRDLFSNPATVVESGTAPANGTNTGWDGTQVVQNSTSGVTGDRKGIHVKLPDGTEYWILWKCGNWVFVGKPPIQLPKGRAGIVEAAGPTTQTPRQPASPSSASPRPTSSAPQPTASPGPTPGPTRSATPTGKSAPAGNNNSTNPAQWGNAGASPTRAAATTTAAMTTIAQPTEGSNPSPAASTTPTASAYPTSGPTCDDNGNGC